MSTLRDDLEQNSPLDLDPLVGLHRPSPDPQPLASEEQNNLGEIEQFSLEESGEEGRLKEALYNSICGNSWRDAKAILDPNPNALTAPIADGGRIALHVAAIFGHVGIVEELLRLLHPQSILIPDCNGNTALIMACALNGRTAVAKCLVNKNRDILVTPNLKGELPVEVAFSCGYQELGRDLYSLTPLQCLTGRRGSALLCYCFRTQCYDIALNLLQYYEELLLVPFHERRTPIHEIAALNTAILSPIELAFWKRWIYNHINIHSTTAINNVCLDIQQEDRDQGDKAKLAKPGISLLRRLINISDNLVGVKKLQELKLLHSQADELVRLVCKKAREAYQKGIIDEALCVAAKEGHADFVFQVLKEIPEIFYGPMAMLFQCFCEALDHRQARVFNLIHGLHFKNALLTVIDSDGNIMLHKAAKKAHPRILSRIYAPTLQMQRELQWFKEVESLTPPGFRLVYDKNDISTVESFRENHKELMKEGEKWIKGTSSSCSVVGALIVTIMFAAAFTVPGGTNQNIGYPLFIQQPFFRVFIFSTILSLLSSSTSVLMFLAILTSKYSEEEFLKSLPTKLILGLSFLFISIVSMIIAFLSTIHLMLNHSNYSWGLLPIMILASVPVSLFVLSQFPLLLHTYVSTYGNIFDRKVEPWP